MTLIFLYSIACTSPSKEESEAPKESKGDSATESEVQDKLLSVELRKPASTDITTRETLELQVIATYESGEVDVTGDSSFSSSDQEVIRFFTPGKGQPVRGGKTTITVQSDLGGGTDFDAFEVNVMASLVQPGELVLNEILADPATDADPNGDGVLDPVQDEFLEVANTSGVTVDISGVRIYDVETESARHTFPLGTMLRAGEALVIFGGGSVATLYQPNVRFEVATNDDVGLKLGLALNNEGDRPVLKLQDGTVICETSYGTQGGNDVIEDASLVLSPDVSGTAYSHHRYVQNSVGNQSPGTYSDGSSFPGAEAYYSQ